MEMLRTIKVYHKQNLLSTTRAKKRGNAGDGAWCGRYGSAKSIASSAMKSLGKNSVKGLAKSAVRRGVAGKLLSGAAGEFVEEAVSEAIDPKIQRLYQISEFDSDDYKPYRVTINVKEKSDGNFVYSFSAESQEGSSTPQTLHAVVNGDNEVTANAQPSNPIIRQKDGVVNHSGEKSTVLRRQREQDSATFGGMYTDESNKPTEFILLQSSWDNRKTTIGIYKQGKYLDLRIHTMYAKKDIKKT